MRGHMLWFNTTKEYGFIRTEDGERLYVHKTGFASGSVPAGRCSDQPVSLTRVADDLGRRAVEVEFVVPEAPAR